jgi:hypothetical protein
VSTAKSDLNALTSDAAYYLMDPLNNLLREMSQAAGWPKEVTDSLYVDFDGERLSVAYPDDMTDEIMDLEYGRGSMLPNSVIRAFIYRSDKVVKTVLASKTADALFELEEVF